MLTPFTALVLTYTMTLQTALVRDKRITLDFHCMRCMVNEEDRLWSVCHVSLYSSWMNSGVNVLNVTCVLIYIGQKLV